MRKEKSYLKFLICFTIIGIFCLSGFLQAEEKKRIAVLNFNAKGLPETYAEGIREMVEVSLYNTNTFDILERNQVDLILKEQDLQVKRCEDTTCGVRIGKLISADMVVTGGITKIDQYTLTVRMVDIKEGRVLLADSESAANESMINKAVQVLAERVAAKSKSLILPKPDAEEHMNVINPTAYYMLGIIPGGAQIYSGHTIKSGVYFTTFLLSTIGSFYAYENYKNKRNAYNNTDGYDMDVHPDKAFFDKKYKDYKKATNIAIYSAGVCGLIYLLNWVDVIFISAPDFQKQNGSINSGDSFISFNLYNKSTLSSDKYIDMSFGIKF